jgi:mannose-1-phosphate guanylyltransferase
VSAAAGLVDRLVLLGVVPDGPELEYGWIQPGREIAWAAGARVRDVTSFVEKPALATARAAIASGALWNTLVMAARVQTLWQLGLEYVPEVVERFERLGSALSTPKEAVVLEEIYAGMPRRNFSTHLLQRAAHRVAVMGLRGVFWSDWGRPERIVETLERLGREPALPFPAAVSSEGVSPKPVLAG